jgi:hypothetical protein
MKEIKEGRKKKGLGDEDMREIIYSIGLNL